MSLLKDAYGYVSDKKIVQECQNKTCDNNCYNNASEKKMVRCNDCSRKKDCFICISCASKCHSGHDTSEIFTSIEKCKCSDNKTNNKQNNSIFERQFQKFFDDNRSPVSIRDLKIQQHVQSRKHINENDQDNNKIYDIKMKTDINTNLSDSININGINTINMTNNEIIYSPFSFMSVFIPFYYGTSGESKKLIKNSFNLDSRDSTINDLVEISKQKNNLITYNTIIINPQLKIKSNYYNKLKNLVDFQVNYDSQSTIQKLDNKVRSVTNGLINTVLNTIDKDMMIILVNIIYFKCNWKYAFEKKNTKIEKFNNKKNVEMMCIHNEHQYYFENGNKKLIEIRYINDNYRFGCFIDESNNKVDYSELNNYIKNLKLEEIHTLKIPKFKKENKINLNNTVKKIMNSDNIFDYKKLELGHMTSAKELFVSDIIQKAVIIVDETGTEAAAVTAMYTRNLAIVEKKRIIFIANVPFTYYIRHIPTNTILFIGKYL